MDTLNRFAVGVRGQDVVVMMPPRVLTPSQAMEFAAWLVVMAQTQDPDDKLPPIAEYIAAVEST